MKAKNMIPCCYHPTTPLLVDDEQAYLDSLVSRLENIPPPYEYNDSSQALDFLTQTYQPSVDTSSWASNLNHAYTLDEIHLDEHEHSLVDIDVSIIHEQLFNPTRFKEIAVVIADYEMPALNGLEFFEKIGDKPFQKLLLTGHASHAMGIQAFNKGIIDKFINKSTIHDEFDFTTTINAAFQEAEKGYFQKLSDNIYQHLAKSPRSALDEPFFLDFFNQTVEKNKIIEYYLVSDTGCFLMLDADGNKSWLLAKSEDDMRYFQNTAVEHHAPITVTDPLKKREKILFLFSRNDFNDVPCEKWGRYFHPAQKFVGEKNVFYCTYTKSKPVYDQQLEKIVSYKEFLIGG